MTELMWIAIIGMFGAVLGGNGMWDFLKSRKKKKSPEEYTKEIIEEAISPIKGMTLALGTDRLNYLCKKYKENGYIPADEYDTFIGLYDSYNVNHGNHGIGIQVEQVLATCPKQ